MGCKEIVKVRNLTIGEGIPKICVPIIGKSREDILHEAYGALKAPVDIVEWRADWYEDVSSFEKVGEVLKELRRVLNELPILFTFRTAREGGQKGIDARAYVELIRAVIKTDMVDLVDIELFMGDTIVEDIVCEAHKRNVKVIASNHDFEKTPEKEELITRLCKMQELNADILKIAVMPQNKKDVLTLLCATEEMVSRYADRPIVTISMGAEGFISRVCGEIFGSAITFGTVQKASAPGQIPVEELSQTLKLLHKNM